MPLTLVNNFNVPGCRARHSATQSLLNGTVTILSLNSTRYDIDNMHDDAVNNSRITFNTSGRFDVGGSLEFEGASDYDFCGVLIKLNGTTFITVQSTTDLDSVSAIWISTSTIWQFNAGDYIEMAGYQVNGAAASRLVTASSSYSPEFWANWVGN